MATESDGPQDVGGPKGAVVPGQFVSDIGNVSVEGAAGGQGLVGLAIILASQAFGVEFDAEEVVLGGPRDG